jgi:hypothetical protein
MMTAAISGARTPPSINKTCQTCAEEQQQDDGFFVVEITIKEIVE